MNIALYVSLSMLMPTATLCMEQISQPDNLPQSDKGTISYGIITKFSCSVNGCNKSYNRKSNMLQHREFKHKICKKCEKTCADFQELQSHKKQAHQKESSNSYEIPCQKCHFIAISMKKYHRELILNKHMLTAHSSDIKNSSFEKISCTIPGCCNSYDMPGSMSQHLEYVHKICKNCSQPFQTYQELQDHNQHVHNRTITYELLCSLCEFRAVGRSSVYTKKKLRKHQVAEHKQRLDLEEFSCTIENCNKSYDTKDGLKYHQESVHKICKKCAQQFDDYQTLQAHNKDIHFRIIEYAIQCPDCDFIIESVEPRLTQQKLKRHREQSHSNETI